MTEKLFKLKENHTDVKTEIMAGVTTFMTMAYILAINPSILGSTGMDPTAVLLATCIASVIGTVCMGLMANLPFVLSAGMGLNAYMAYTVVAGGTACGFCRGDCIYRAFSYKRQRSHFQCNTCGAEKSGVRWHRSLHCLYRTSECRTLR